jgi:tripartite-type tricarboxylate transporter receptor subunit TctC
MRRLLIAVAFLASCGSIAMAQVYPSRPVTMVVPFPAGGSTDTIGRVMADGMRGPLGRSVIIENVGGASGNLGVGRVARAQPDGYTLILGSWPTHVLNAAIFTLPYDPLNDFEPVSLVAAQPLFIIARKAMPARDLTELVAWLKANPDKATQGTAGTGGASHLAGVFFQKATGTRFQFVPYRGSAPAMQDLLAGQIDMMIDLAASATPQVRAGNVKAYAVTAKSRLAAAPDVPTVDEAGLPGYYVPRGKSHRPKIFSVFKILGLMGGSLGQRAGQQAPHQSARPRISATTEVTPRWWWCHPPSLPLALAGWPLFDFASVMRDRPGVWPSLHPSGSRPTP